MKSFFQGMSATTGAIAAVVIIAALVGIGCLCCLATPYSIEMMQHILEAKPY